MSKGRLKTCMKVLMGVFVVFFYSLPSWAEDDVAQMQKELRALKAELEALRSEMKSDKDTLKAHDDELLASKQEFSQLSSEVRNWRANPEAVETLKDQIKKELGFVPNVYNEMANKIRMGFELRTRGEFENNWHAVVHHLPEAANATGGANTTGVGRGGGRDEDTTIILNRVRFNIDADVHENLRTFVQFQDSRFWGWEGKDGHTYILEPVGFGTDNANNRIDIHQAYVDIKKLFNPNLVFRVGRQEIIWGTPGPGDIGHRVLGDFGWSNIGVTFDAIRTMWTTERYGAEAFASVIRKYEAAAGGRNRQDEDHQLYGTKLTFKKLIPNGTLELMYLMDNDQQEVSVETADTGGGAGGEMEVHDAGFRAVGKIGKPVDYFAEYHYQLGDFRGRAHEAMAGVIGAGYTFDKVAWKPRAGYEFDWSPGDPRIPANDSSGNKHRTFHNFYPTNHAHYGYADLMAWKNMRGHRVQIKVFPTKKLTAWVDFWKLDLDQGRDAWYHAGQGPLRAQSTAAGARDRTTNLGKEIDLTLNYSLYKNVGILSGYSKFLGGAAARRVDGSNSDGDTDWGFVQLTVSF